MMTEDDWLSAHFFYQGDLDVLLRGLVGPLVELLGSTGVSDDFFFLRYWDGGNHLRLRISAPRERDKDHARRLTTELAESYFRDCPASDVMTLAEYRRIAPSLAGRERLSDFARELRPNNSLEFVPYRREWERYGDDKSMRAVEEHFADASRIALDLVVRGLSAAQRDVAGYSMVLITWLCWQPDPASLRDDAERFRRSWRDGVDTGGTALDERALDERFERQRPKLVPLARRLCTLCERPSSGEGTLAAWTESVVRLRNALGPGERTPNVLDVCAHLMCNRLGVSMAQEIHLRHLAAGAVAAMAEAGSDTWTGIG